MPTRKPRKTEAEQEAADVRRQRRREMNEMKTQVGQVVRTLANGKLTPQEEAQQEAFKLLSRLGDHRVDNDAIRVEGKEFVVPDVYADDLGAAADFLLEVEEEQEKPHMFKRQYKARPFDGAMATMNTLKDLFGSEGVGKSTFNIFEGTKPPQMVSIPIGPKDTAQAPWGEIKFDLLRGDLHLDSWRHPELGILFELAVVAPKKFKGYVEGLFEAVQHELNMNSIYRGKAIDGQEMPEFMDLSGVDPAEIVYPESVDRQLRAQVWGLIEKYERQKELRLPMKRAILLAGDYGTGKTEAARLTAIRAMSAKPSWTFIHVRPGHDDLGLALSTARLYQPSIVFIEDIDTHAAVGDKDAVSWILEKFDGISSKGTEIMMLMTTNYPKHIVKGMLRPGRMDGIINFEGFDTDAVHKLIEVLVPSELLAEKIDWDHIGKAAGGLTPAFVREMIDRAKRYALDALDDNAAFKLSTDDFADSALGLQEQLKLMNDAGEAKPRDPLSEAFKAQITNVLESTRFIDSEGDETVGEYAARLAVKENTGNGRRK